MPTGLKPGGAAPPMQPFGAASFSVPYPASIGSAGPTIDLGTLMQAGTQQYQGPDVGPYSDAWLEILNYSDSVLSPQFDTGGQAHPPIPAGYAWSAPIPVTARFCTTTIAMQTAVQFFPNEVLFATFYTASDIRHGFHPRAGPLVPSVPAASIGPGPLPAGVTDNNPGVFTPATLSSGALPVGVTIAGSQVTSIVNDAAFADQADTLGTGGNSILSARETGGTPHWVDSLTTTNHGGSDGTALNGQVVSGGVAVSYRLMNEDGTLPTGQLAAGALPAGVTIPGSQVTGASPNVATIARQTITVTTAVTLLTYSNASGTYRFSGSLDIGNGTANAKPTFIVKFTDDRGFADQAYIMADDATTNNVRSLDGASCSFPATWGCVTCAPCVFGANAGTITVQYLTTGTPSDVVSGVLERLL